MESHPIVIKDFSCPDDGRGVVDKYATEDIESSTSSSNVLWSSGVHQYNPFRAQKTLCVGILALIVLLTAMFEYSIPVKFLPAGHYPAALSSALSSNTLGREDPKVPSRMQEDQSDSMESKGSFVSTIGDFNHSTVCQGYIFLGDEVLILRMTSRLSDIKRSIIQKYSNHLKGNMDLWILVDQTNLNATEQHHANEEFRQLQAEAEYRISIFIYDLDTEKRVFPTAKGRFDRVGPELNHCMQATSIVLWWHICGVYNVPRALSDEGNHYEASMPKAVWSIETDAGFSGDPMVFFDFYKGSPYDLIVNRVRSAANPWLAYKRKEAADASELPDEFYYEKNDFVSRFSPRLLYHLEVLIKASVIFYGEAYEATVCKSLLSDWCTLRSFRDDGFAGDVLSAAGRISSQDWSIYNQQPEYQNKWYHAVLSYRERPARVLTNAPKSAESP